MKKYVYDEPGEHLLRIENAEPVCGEDFCDSCGDCLHCYGGDFCYGNNSGEHFWVQYSEEQPGKEGDDD